MGPLALLPFLEIKVWRRRRALIAPVSGATACCLLQAVTKWDVSKSIGWYPASYFTA
jgi:hypothetical protein